MTDIPISDLIKKEGAELFENAPKISFTCELGKEAQYLITMNNHYISPKGQVIKTQSLSAGYKKVFQTSLTPKSAVCTYTWGDVQFHSHKWNGDAVDSSWTFAKGETFSNLVTFPEKIKSIPKDKEYKGEIGIDYSHLASTPTVNLLYMLSWDVIGLEEMASHLARTSESISGVGQFTEVSTISDIRAYMQFGGCKDNSFFDNGQFEMAYLGLSMCNGHLGALYEYRCFGKLEVNNAKNKANAQSQKGTSYYFGKVLVDIESGDLLRGDMIELVSGVTVNKEGKLVPQQKRRFVQLELAAD